jgi:hypothetical protein
VQQRLDERVERVRGRDVREAVAEVNAPRLLLAEHVGRDPLVEEGVPMRDGARAGDAHTELVTVAAGGDGAGGDGPIVRRRIPQPVGHARSGRTGEGGGRAERGRGRVHVAPCGPRIRDLAGLQHAVADGVDGEGPRLQPAEAAAHGLRRAPVPDDQEIADRIAGEIEAEDVVVRNAGAPEAASETDGAEAGPCHARQLDQRVETAYGHVEVAGGVHAQLHRVVALRRRRTEPEVVGLGRAGGVVQAREDPRLGPHRTHPGDGGPAVTCGAHGRRELVPGRRHVDPELGPDARALGIEAAGEDAQAVGIGAGPRGHEPAAGQGGHLGPALVTDGRDVDGELAAQGDATGVEALPEDSPAAAVLALARPDHDEGSGGQGHRAVALGPRQDGVHAELGGHGDGLGVEEAREHVGAVGGDDHEPPAFVDVHV